MTNGRAVPIRRATLREQELLGQGLLRGACTGDGALEHRSSTTEPDDHEVDGYLSQIALGDPGMCCDTATTTFVVTDNSGSVAGGGGSDPTTRRHDEALLTIRHVSATCHCGRERVALLPFDQPSLGLVLPQGLDKRGVRRLKRGMVIAERTGASSSLLPALSVAEQLAKLTPNHAAVVVLSDFELCDHDPAQVLDRLANFPGHVHAVVLGGCVPLELENDGRVAMSVITPRSEPGEVARAVFDGLTRYRQGVVGR